MLKSFALAATASVSGCLTEARSDPQPDTPTAFLPNVTGPQFRRIERTNAYELSYTWSHRDRRRTIDLAVSKERYHSATRASRSIPRCFSTAVTSALAGRVATELSQHCDAAGIDSPVERLRFATAFVRSLEYRRDAADAGELEYPKYVEETITENGGDCEDLATLLAGILSSPPFDHDVDLLVFSGHVGLGVDPSPFAESVEPLLAVGGQEHLYVDASIDTPLGRVPPTYRDPGVVARYDGTWRVVDPAGLREHAATTIANGTAGELGDYV